LRARSKLDEIATTRLQRQLFKKSFKAGNFHESWSHVFEIFTHGDGDQRGLDDNINDHEPFIHATAPSFSPDLQNYRLPLRNMTAAEESPARPV
jgi:hypothetical protein